MHVLPDKKFIRSHVPGYRPDWLAVIIVNYGLDLNNTFGSSFLLRNVQSEVSTQRENE